MSEPNKESLELQHLQIGLEKLRLEVEALRDSTFWDRLVGRYLPLVTAILAVSGFWVGLIQYFNQQAETSKQRDEVVRQRSEELRREAAKPFWDSQLELYLQASEAASIVATSTDLEAVSRAEGQFWLLYWGPLAIVEDVGMEKKPVAEVERAMIRYGQYIRTNPTERCREKMQQLSLDLAHAMRQSVAPSFDLKPTELSGERTKSAD